MRDPHRGRLLGIVPAAGLRRLVRRSFPGEENLPGTALFLIAVIAAGRVMKGTFAGASAVKFQHEAGPESELEISVRRKPDASCAYSFTLSDGTPVSSGTLKYNGSGS